MRADHSQATVPSIGLPYLLGLLLVATVTVAVYAPGLSGPFLFDDHAVLDRLVDPDRPDWGALVNNNIVSHSGPLGRPVAMATFLLNALTSDATWSWKLVNLLLHVANGILLFFLTRELAVRTGAEGVGPASGLGLAVAALWLLHPLHVSSVLYTVQRMTLLAALFQFAGLLLYLRARRPTVPPRRRNVLLFATVTCFLFGIFSKENAALLPLQLLLLELTVLRDRDDGKRYIRTLLALLVIGVVAGLTLGLDPRGGYATRPYTMAERLLTETRVMVDYVTLTLVPRLDAMSLFHDDITISTGLWTPPTTAAALLLLLGLPVVAFAIRRAVPLATFGILFFLAGHLVESTVFPLDLMYEHRQYLPAYGLLLAACAVINRFVGRRRLPVIGVTAAAALLAMTTGLRAHAWGDEWRLYDRLLRVKADSPTVTTTVANRLAEVGNLPGARALLARHPSTGTELNLLYLDCMEHRALPDEALDAVVIQPGQRLDFYVTSGLINLGLAGLDGRCRFSDDAFVRLLDRALAGVIHGQRNAVTFYRAHYLHRLGRLDEAVATLESTASKGPVGLFLAAEWLIDAGRLQQAEELIERGRGIDRRSWRDYGHLAAAATVRLRTAREDPTRLKPFDPRAGD